MAINLDFTGKKVIVTGGANGIGKAIAEGVVKAGGFVIIADLNETAAEKVRAELGEENAAVYKVDLGNSSEIREVFSRILEEQGQIHVLVNNAGIVSTVPFEEISQEEWDRIVAINLTGVYAALQVVYPAMKDGQNTASVAGKIGGGLLGTSAYAATKSGVIGLSKAIAKEGAKYGIACNAVCPSLTKTSMTANMGEEKYKRIVSGIPMGRPADPSEVANVILFYASDLASFVTGEVADVDGGITMD